MSTRLWFRLHSFAGVLAGLLLFVVCWSGTFATLSNEIDWLLTPSLRAESASAFDPDAVERAALAAHPGARLLWMSRPQSNGFAVDVVLEAPPYRMWHAHVAPANARHQGGTGYFNVQRFFRSLHMALFLPYGAGIYVVGAAGVFLLMSLITPLLFYRRWWTRWFRLRTDGNTRAVTSEVHKLTGLWSLWFVALIALTGIWYMVEQIMIDAADVGFIYPDPPAFAGATEPRLPLSAFIAAARRHRPALQPANLGVTESGLVYVSGQAGNLLTRDRANTLYFDPSTAAIVEDRRADTLGPLRRWIEAVDLLHFGTFAGLATKLLWFVFGLLLSGLCLTGAYLHACRLGAGSAHRARWPGTGVCVAATLSLFCASVFGAFAEARRLGPTLGGIPHLPALPGATLAFIIGWTALTAVLIGLWVYWLRRASTWRGHTSDRREARVHS